MIRKGILLIVSVLCCQIGFSQELDEKTVTIVKVKLITAENAYKKGEYSIANTKIIEIENIVGKNTFEDIQNLKVKILLGQKSFELAKKELNALYEMNPSDEVITDIATYADKIDDGIIKIKRNKELRKIADEKARLKYIEEQNLILINKIESDRLAKLEKDRVIEAKRKKDAMASHHKLTTKSNYFSKLKYVFHKKEKGKFGLVDKRGDIIKAYNYTDYSYRHTDKGIYMMKKNRLWYFFNSLNNNFKNFISPQIDPPNFSQRSLYLVQNMNKNKYGWINSKFEIAVPIIYESFHHPRNGRIAVKLGGKWGFINYLGKEIIPFKYDKILTNSFPIKVRLNGKEFFIDERGKSVSSFDNGTFEFSEGLAKVEKNKKFGFVNKEKEIVIPIIYDHAYKFQNGNAEVKIGEKSGIIDKTGKIILDIKYDRIHNTGNNGIRQVELNKLKGLINKKGNFISEVKYTYINGFGSSNYSLVDINNKMGLINTDGKEIIPVIYDVTSVYQVYDYTGNNLQSFDQKYFIVSQGGLKGIYNNLGDLLIPVKYEKISYLKVKGGKSIPFSTYLNGENFLHDSSGAIINDIVQIGKPIKGFILSFFKNKFGFVNEKGNVKIEFQYDKAEDFTEDGFARVQMNKKWGMINKKGKLVIPCIYKSINDFSEGLAAATLENDKSGYINKKNKVVIPFDFFVARDFKDGKAQVSDELFSKKYFINKKGKPIKKN